MFIGNKDVVLALAVAWLRVKRAHGTHDATSVALSSHDTKHLAPYGKLLIKLDIQHANLTGNVVYRVRLTNVVGLCRVSAGLQNREMSIMIARRLSQFVAQCMSRFAAESDHRDACMMMMPTCIAILGNHDPKVRKACITVCKQVLLSLKERFYCRGLLNLLYILEAALHLCGFDTKYIKGNSAVWETFSEVYMGVEADESRPKVQLQYVIGDDIELANMFVNELVKLVGYLVAKRVPLRTKAIGIMKRRILSILLATHNPALKQFYKIDWSFIC